jgi:hypothetical protein
LFSAPVHNPVEKHHEDSESWKDQDDADPSELEPPCGQSIESYGYHTKYGAEKGELLQRGSFESYHFSPLMEFLHYSTC